MTSGGAEEKFDWNKTWVAEMLLSEEEQEQRSPLTPEEKRLNEIKGGIITSFVGVGVMIFLYFLFHEVPIDNSSDDDEILHNVWMAGIIPFLIGIAIIINGLFISRRLVKLKEQQAQTALPLSPTAQPSAMPAKTTDQLITDAAPSMSYSVIENTTAHLSNSVTVKPVGED